MSALAPALLLLLLGAVRGAPPIAPHKWVEVAAAGFEVISLQGTDKDGDARTATVTALPAGGKLYQLSNIYSKYGYDPVAGVEIAAPGTRVTGSRNRVVYKRPPSDVEAYGAWDTFKYTVHDGSATSQEGTIWLLPPSRIVVGSDFTRSSEEWTITGDTASNTAVTYEATSRGSMNRFIHGTDGLIQIDATSDSCDQSRWSFSAPAAFLGHQGVAYGGALSFSLSSFSGDFSPEKAAPGLHLVEMECATCEKNAGVTLAFPASAAAAFTGTTAAYRVPLTETGGWLKDPENTLAAWEVPSKCLMMEVLAGLSALRIAGDFTCWYETVALDNVALSAPASQLPLCSRGADPTAIGYGNPNLTACACR